MARPVRVKLISRPEEDFVGYLDFVGHNIADFRKPYADDNNLLPGTVKFYVVPTEYIEAVTGVDAAARTEAQIIGGAPLHAARILVADEWLLAVGVDREVETTAQVPQQEDVHRAAEGAGGTARKRARVEFAVPPAAITITVRDWEVKGREEPVVVPDSWEECRQRLQQLCALSEGDRLYYFCRQTMAVEHRRRLASAEDFAAYAGLLTMTGRLPDVWVVRCPPGQASAVSPDQVPTTEAPAAAAAGARSVGSRSSAQQAAFREMVLHRDARHSRPVCALCSSEGDVQAAHIVPQDAGLDDMEAAALHGTYDVRNGLLLCDRCHDLFDEFLWSVDGEGRVVVSEAMKAIEPARGPLSERLFSKDTRDAPLASVWAWHFRCFEDRRSVRHATAAAKPFACQRCGQGCKSERGKQRHEEGCRAREVRIAHYRTPLKADGGGAGASS